MERSRAFATLLVAAAALLVLAGCSSSNNNKSNNKNAPTTAATTLAPVATVVRTPTPIPAVVRTPTPVIAGAAAGRTPTPTAGADPILQSALAAAALKSTDVPSGYTPMGSADTSLDVPGETAAYQQTYTNLGSIPNLGLLLDGLLGFKDVASAQAAFANLQSELQTADSDLNLKLTPVTAPTKIGDDTQVYSLSIAAQGFTFNGFLVAWRRGRVGATLAQAGSGTLALTGANDVITLAQKQDTTLQSVKQ